MDSDDELPDEPPTDDQIQRWIDEHAARSAARPANATTNGDTPELGGLPQPIDWAEFWARDLADADWVFEGVLARGRAHSIYAAHKAGKSLFALHMVGEMVTGPDPTVVIYLDFEMTEDDLKERLEDMGYGPASDLDRLHYYLLPALRPLDSPAGAADLAAIVDLTEQHHPDHHIVVVIDTTGRAVVGEENSADTYQAFYRCSGLMLKRRGVTWARLDHAGKNEDAGQRGSSAKGDDVDIVWKLAPDDNGITLTRELTRMSWVPDKIAYTKREDPLTFERTHQAVPAGTKECMSALDRLGAPLDISSRAAQRLLRTNDEGARYTVVLAAVKARHEPHPDPLDDDF